jgi:hypothetical protein
MSENWQARCEAAEDSLLRLQEETDALRERNRRLKEANDKEHQRLAGAKDKARARAIRAEQANRELTSELLRLQERVREVLGPFALVAREYAEDVPDLDKVWVLEYDNGSKLSIFVRAFRAAAALLQSLGEEGK